MTDPTTKAMTTKEAEKKLKYAIEDALYFRLEDHYKRADELRTEEIAALAHLTALAGENERLRGEVERRCKDAAKLISRAEKAEAKLAKMTEERNAVSAVAVSWAEKCSEADTYTARWKPLIEAAKKASPEWIVIETEELSRIRTGDTPTMNLLRAALKCREEKP